jgi:hypothetical protein
MRKWLIAAILVAAAYIGYPYLTSIGSTTRF